MTSHRYTHRPSAVPGGYYDRVDPPRRAFGGRS
jgi:hypothetical protein